MSSAINFPRSLPSPSFHGLRSCGVRFGYKEYRKKGGRRDGAHNKVTRALEEFFLTAEAGHREADEGIDCLVGYLAMLALKDERTFATLLGPALAIEFKELL